MTGHELQQLVDRVCSQESRLHAMPLPTDFTYDRNGLRLGIAALEDELNELYDEWKERKGGLDTQESRNRIRHEVLDIAAVAMIIFSNIPDDY